jgi:hypothetical protein
MPPARRSGAVGGRRNVPDLVSRGYVPPPLHSVVRELLESDWWCDLCGDELTVAFSIGNVCYRGCRNDPRMKLFLSESSPEGPDS